VVLGANRSVDAIANTLWGVRLAQPRKAIILVEGDDDERFLARHTNTRACHLHVPYGRPRVLSVLAELRARGVAGVLAIADADFDRLLGSVRPDPNVILTETHDIETLLVCSPAFENVLRELGDADRVETAECAAGMPAREIILRAAAPIGAARLVCRRQGWSVKFDEINYERFVDLNSLQVDVDALIREMAGRQAGAPAHSRMTPNAHSLVAAELNLGHPLSDLCQGHDVVAILGLSLRRLFGQRLANEVKPDRLGTALRLAFEREHFRQANLATEIHAWLARNPMFTIF
jgi:hypothetical protein